MWPKTSFSSVLLSSKMNTYYRHFYMQRDDGTQKGWDNVRERERGSAWAGGESNQTNDREKALE